MPMHESSGQHGAISASNEGRGFKGEQHTGQAVASEGRSEHVPRAFIDHHRHNAIRVLTNGMTNGQHSSTKCSLKSSVSGRLSLLLLLFASSDIHTDRQLFNLYHFCPSLCI